MRISVDNKDRSHVNFGYSQSFNKKVETVLKKHSSELNNKLLELNTFCNTTEDLIDKHQRECVSWSETEPIFNIFLDAKTTLVNSINTNFPSLNYLRNECINYFKESNKKNSFWKRAIVETLNSMIQPVQPQTKPLAEEIVPQVNSSAGLSSISGRSNLKKLLKDKIIDPLKYPELAAKDVNEYGCKFPNNVMLYGPEGCNKRDIAEAIAREANLSFFVTKPDSNVLLPNGTWSQEGVFDFLSQKAKRDGKPVILYIDGLKSLTDEMLAMQPHEAQSLKSLLSLIHKSKREEIIVISSVKKDDYKSINQDIKSCFDSHIEIGLPDIKSRIELLKKNMMSKEKATSVLKSSKDLSDIAKHLEGFSNRAIDQLCDEAAYIAKNDGRRAIRKEDYIQSIKNNPNLRAQPNKKPLGFNLNDNDSNIV